MELTPVYMRSPWYQAQIGSRSRPAIPFRRQANSNLVWVRFTGRLLSDFKPVTEISGVARLRSVTR